MLCAKHSANIVLFIFSENIPFVHHSVATQKLPPPLLPPQLPSPFYRAKHIDLISPIKLDNLFIHLLIQRALFSSILHGIFAFICLCSILAVHCCWLAHYFLFVLLLNGFFAIISRCLYLPMDICCVKSE